MSQIPLNNKEIDERIADVMRLSYGRLVAILSAKFRDIELVEDAVSDAFAKALSTWPQDGAPKNAEAWLYQVARNRILDHLKSATHKTSDPLDAEVLEVTELEERTMAYNDEEMSLPDERLRLMFTCAHPAIDARVRAPLILQTILGLDAKAIAGLYGVASKTMAQRLVRAKQKIKQARIPFHLPHDAVLSERLTDVLEAIYGAYSQDWQTHDVGFFDSLYGEAKYLIDLLVAAFPDEPEVLGLAALIGFSLARQGKSQNYIPLQDQDPNSWDHQLINESEALLHRAGQIGRIGRFQLEAAIQSAHCARRTGVDTDRVAISQLYYGLMQLAPTLGGSVAMASALGHAYGAERALAQLDVLPQQDVADYLPYWAVRAHFLSQLGTLNDAMAAYDKAIELCHNPQVKAYLIKQRSGFKLQ